MSCGLKYECKAEKCSFCVVGENGRTGFSPIDTSECVKEWNMGYQRGVADERPKAFAKGFDSGFQKGIEKFSEILKSRLTDAIYQKDVPSMSNLIDDVAEEIVKEKNR